MSTYDQKGVNTKTALLSPYLIPDLITIIKNYLLGLPDHVYIGAHVEYSYTNKNSGNQRVCNQRRKVKGADFVYFIFNDSKEPKKLLVSLKNREKIFSPGQLLPCLCKSKPCSDPESDSDSDSE